MTASSEPSDAELVRESLTGNREAYGRLVTRYQSLVSSLAFCASGNLARSEDVAQEAFVAAWKSLPTLREPERFRPWLCGIARNLGNNAARRRGRSAIDTAANLEDLPDSADDRDSPLDAAISQEEADLVWQSLDQLPEAYREPLVLYYREEQSISRVAEALDLSQDTVKQRLSRGRKLLKSQVEELVETSLTRTKPSAAFAVAVLAALPAMLPQAATAAVAAGAGKGSALAKSAAMAGLSGAVLGPVLGILGALFGISCGLRAAKSDQERRFILRMAWVTVGLVIGYTAGLMAVIYFGRSLLPDHRNLFAGLLSGTILGYIVLLFVVIVWGNRRMRQIQIETGTYVERQVWGVVNGTDNKVSRRNIIGSYVGGMAGTVCGIAGLPFRQGDWVSIGILVVCSILVSLVGMRATLAKPGNSIKHLSWTFGIMGAATLLMLNLRFDHWFPELGKNAFALRWVHWGMNVFFVLLYAGIIGSWWLTRQPVRPREK